MKTILKLILLLGLISLVSCGAKKSGMTLQISNGMAISNTTYDGGLVFFGRSTDGKIFSAPVPFNTGSGNQMQIDLDRGDWTFGAVGWKNNANKFEGDAECAVVTAKLDSVEQTINLDLDPTGCTNAAFGGNMVGNNFKPLRIITCGTFYQDISNPGAAFTDNYNYCANNVTTLHSEMKLHAKSARVFVPVIIPGQTPNSNSPLSECIPLSNGIISAPSKRFPAKGMPIQVELFDGLSCDGEILAGYVMADGFDKTYAGFDHKYYNTTQTMLYLLSTISRRGTTSLLGSMPKFVCDATTDSPCIKIPLVTSNDRAITADNFFFLKDAGTDTCAELSTTGHVQVASTNVAGWNAATHCELRGDKIFIRLPAAAITGCAGTCTLDVAFSPTYSLNIKSLAMPEALGAYDLIFRTVGYQDVLTYSLGTPALSGYLSLHVFHEHEEKNDSERKFFGELSRVREMLAPAGLGGIFQGLTSADLNSKAINLSFWDKGIQKSYRIVSQADTALVPDYIHNNSDAGAIGNSTIAYTHRVTISRIIGGAFIPEQIIRIKHGSQIGMMESLDVESDSVKDEKRTERSLLFWNTQSGDYGRFEKYHYDKTVQNSNPTILLDLKTTFSRAERDAAAGQYAARIDEYSFETRRVSGVYNETASKKVALLKGAAAMYGQSFAHGNSAANPLDYFTNDFFTDFNNSAAVTRNTAYARSPNSNYTIMAWPEWAGSGWNLKIVRQSIGAARVINTVTVGSDTEIYPKVTINNSGEATVAWIKTIGSNNYIYAMAWNGTVWKEATGSNATIAGETITTGGALATYASPLKIDIVDGDTLSNTSEKVLIYSFFQTGWKINVKSYYSGTWTAEAQISATAMPKDLKIVKADASDYYITYAYNSSGDKVAVLKTDLTTIGSSDVESITSAAASLITKFNPNTTDLNVYVVDYANQANNQQSVFSGGSMTAFSSLSSANFQFNFGTNSYCFQRSTTVAYELGSASIAPSASCVTPATSYSFPIKSIYKFDIESLKPTTFIGIFSM